jgi:hypothetical protein
MMWFPINEVHVRSCKVSAGSTLGNIFIVLRTVFIRGSSTDPDGGGVASMGPRSDLYINIARLGRAISHAVSRRLPRFEPRSGHVGFVMDKVVLRQAFSEYFGFPCQFSFHRLLHTHHLSSRAGTIGQ